MTVTWEALNLCPRGSFALKWRPPGGGCLDCLASGCLESGLGRGDWGGQEGPELKREPSREKGEKEDWLAAGGEQERRRASQETGVIFSLV